MLYLNYSFFKYLPNVKRFGSLRERRYISVYIIITIIIIIINPYLYEAQSVAEKPCILFLRRSGPLKSHLLNLMGNYSLVGVIMKYNCCK